ncbi:hypothetical protein N0X72_01950 [Streptomyces carpaticus]|uniref:Uncharacterized protein n=1 Tax=Streptomyces harbinensis TaxID=1176198 RepID=A0A1I6R0E3_9ACTN|nr:MULTISPECIES: hypothetical protein [Streptomyces]UWM47865.1 hypothetical protein N0X72_01950 [Streptomyces carpaticus]SFS58189.1 hypothetical protein SAMN05444716_102615 [Streptomyces harbinensis]
MARSTPFAQRAVSGPLLEDSPGDIGTAASPVLATPAAAAAFAAGATIVVGAYVVGRMVGGETEPVIQ